MQQLRTNIYVCHHSIRFNIRTTHSLVQLGDNVTNKALCKINWFLYYNYYYRYPGDAIAKVTMILGNANSRYGNFLVSDCNKQTTLGFCGLFVPVLTHN